MYCTVCESYQQIRSDDQPTPVGAVSHCRPATKAIEDSDEPSCSARQVLFEDEPRRVVSGEGTTAPFYPGSARCIGAQVQTTHFTSECGHLHTACPRIADVERVQLHPHGACLSVFPYIRATISIAQVECAGQ